MYYWYKTPQYEARLGMEALALKAHFPAARLLRDTNGQLHWVLTVRSVQGNPYEVCLTYPQDFPTHAIQAFVLSPQLTENIPHIYMTRELCLGHSATARTSAVTIATWTAAWLSAFEFWRATGEWPEFNS